MSDKKQTLQEQIEYYLSDKNLRSDHFFHEKISSHPEGFLEIKLLLNCNKIRKCGATISDVVSEIEKSAELELNTAKTFVRRMNNRELPPLELKTRPKRRKDEEQKKEQDAEGPTKEEEDPLKLTEADFNAPIVLVVSLASGKEEETKISRKDLEEAISAKHPRLKVIYSRIKSHEGHVAVSKVKTDSAGLAALCKSGVTVDGHALVFKEANDKE